MTGPAHFRFSLPLPAQTSSHPQCAPPKSFVMKTLPLTPTRSRTCGRNSRKSVKNDDFTKKGGGGYLWRRKLGSVLRGDLDLLISTEAAPSADAVQKALEGPLRADAEILGYPGLTIEPARTAGEFSKLAVRAGTRILFTIDLTRISAIIRKMGAKVLAAA